MTGAAALLLEAARREELHHSLILHGPSPAVLLETAVRVAKALTCLERTTGDDCLSCQKIDRGNHPDVHLVQISDDRKLISAEQVRDVVSSATLKPYEGRWKVFIIERADATSVTAANVLLKTLEEPTGQTAFMLLTRSPDLLLPTIRSRSQSIYIGPPVMPRATGLQSLQASRFSREETLHGLEPGSSAALASGIVEALDAYASDGDNAALLGIAPLLASQEDAGTALALFAAVLRDLAALPLEDQLDPARARRIRERLSAATLLSAAALAVRSLSRLVVNADPRMLAEQSLAELAQEK
ncbi:MAG TPA: hypothetical protein VMS12_13455 [Thermoanaerobaculia bacterium]|nr:hypothetical protein [Thermoanaerobaculia bacterium]